MFLCVCALLYRSAIAAAYLFRERAYRAASLLSFVGRHSHSVLDVRAVKRRLIFPVSFSVRSLRFFEDLLGFGWCGVWCCAVLCVRFSTTTLVLDGFVVGWGHPFIPFWERAHTHTKGEGN